MDPLFIGEEVAKTTEAICNLRSVVSVSTVEQPLPSGLEARIMRLKRTYRFVWAHVLCRIGVLDGPVVPLNHAAESSSCFQESASYKCLQATARSESHPFAGIAAPTQPWRSSRRGRFPHWGSSCSPPVNY